MRPSTFPMIMLISNKKCMKTVLCFTEMSNQRNSSQRIRPKSITSLNLTKNLSRMNNLLCLNDRSLAMMTDQETNLTIFCKIDHQNSLVYKEKGRLKILPLSTKARNLKKLWSLNNLIWPKVSTISNRQDRKERKTMIRAIRRWLQTKKTQIFDFLYSYWNIISYHLKRVDHS